MALTFATPNKKGIEIVLKNKDVDFRSAGSQSEHLLSICNLKFSICGWISSLKDGK